MCERMLMRIHCFRVCILERSAKLVLSCYDVSIFMLRVLIRNKTFTVLERLKGRMAAIVLALQIRVLALRLQSTQVFRLLLSKSLEFFDVHPVLRECPGFKFPGMRNVCKCVLGIA